MKYKEVRDKTLMLLNQYSVAGEKMEASYNDQQDYLNRIPSLVNDAVMEIATTYRKIPVVLRLNDLTAEDLGGAARYELPDDFFQFRSGDALLTTEDGRVLHTNVCAIQGRKYLLVPKGEARRLGDCAVTYYRYPRPLDPLSPDENDELDNVPETHYAVPYYVASFLVSQDDPFLCSLLYNKYEDRLGKMGPDVSAAAAQTEDAFGFFSGCED